MLRMLPLHFRKALLPLMALAAFAGCKKDLDTPPIHTLPTGAVVNIAQLKAMYTNASVHFPSALSVYAVVIGDENDGNFYKNVYVQDSTGGICLRLLSSGGLYIGDRIRIYLPGTVLGPYNGLMQLDSVNVDNNVVKQATLVPVAPRVVTIAELTPAALVAWQSTLVQLDSVEFIAAEAAGSTWSDAVGQTNVDRHLEDCNLDQVVVRTSGYANYAGLALPQGKGSIVCVASIYGSTVQLYVRTLPEVHMTGTRCPGQALPILFKNFDDQSMTSGGWSQHIIGDSIPWAISTYNGSSYAKITNYVNGVNHDAETWLISPSINLSSYPTAALAFRTASNYTGADLQTLVSTDYDGTSAPGTATWTPLTAVLSPGSWAWTASGAVSLNSYLTANTHVAFRYIGAVAGGKAYELDEIKISQ